MQGAITALEGSAEVDFTSATAPPTARARLSCQSALRYLDNSSSDWEWLLSPWKVSAEYLYTRPRADTAAASATPAQFVSISSGQHAILRLSPACLLLCGDVIMFARTLLAEDDADVPNNGVSDTDNGGGGGDVGADMPTGRSRRGRGGAAPAMEEQMALHKELTERVPQRYCIQNHLGVRLWYWAPGEHACPRHELPVNASQQLRFQPPVRSIVMEHGTAGKVCALAVLVGAIAPLWSCA